MTDSKVRPTLIAEGARLGETVPRAVIDRATASVGIPPEPGFNAGEEIDIIRKRLEDLRQQLNAASDIVRDGARQGARQAEAGVKLYPMSSLLAAAAATAALTLAIVGLSPRSRRSRYERVFDDLRGLYDSAFERL